MNRLPPNQYLKSFHPLIVLFLGCLWGLGVEAQAIAQEDGAESSIVDIREGRISVSAKNVPLMLLCRDIEEKSGVRFRTQDSLLGDNLSIDFKNFPLLEGIERLLAHVNYLLYFDHRNKLSEVFILRQEKPYSPAVLRKPLSRRGVLGARSSLNTVNRSRR